MASSSSSSLISGSNPPKYDVFLSFRGEDTRNTFTSHLYAALCRSKIETFFDDCEVRTGDEISSSLSNAIRSSSLSIIIFSKEYASSSWCLNELLEIIECHKTTRGRHKVLPIFYHVSPSEIRKQTGTYGEAFAIHEERFKETKDKVQKWRTALEKVANLSGTVINHDRPDPEFIDVIVEDVSCKLKLTSSGDYLDPGLVGITSRIERVESLLCIGREDIRIIGIWGMGGIGKTTIAKAIFHRIAKRFEAVCFLADVKNEAKKGLQHLQEKLLSKIFGEQNLNMEAFMVRKLRSKKILLVLDDVEDSEHLKVSVDRRLFGLGSRIIITSRDRQVLYHIGVGKFELYKVEGLNDREALQLFNENAFKQSFSPEDHMELPRMVVSYCGGNPLALQVLGGSLLGKSMLQWNSLLDKLKKYPNPEIQEVLRISYDGLDSEEKEIFLFIACFFEGEDLDQVINILDCCEYSTRIGISGLLDKCLLTITKNRLTMHDLIQEMGRGIGIQESIKEPGKRSRLWDPQDICDLFKKNTGISEVESISLYLSQIASEPYLSLDAFTRMPRLNLLKSYNLHKEMNKVKIREGVLESLTDDLRYLCWHGYPSKSLQSNFNPNLLVQLDMPCSNLQHLWEGTMDLRKLRQINLEGCEQLIEVPDLSRAPKLHVMNLYGCSNVTKFPKISRNQKELYLSYNAVEEIPSWRHLTSLEILHLIGCSNITKFPQISGAITHLFLRGTAIEEVPNSAFKSLNKLVKLDLSGNTRLKNLPSGMIHLTSLEILLLNGCSNITKFPQISEAITELELSGTAIDEVPNSAIESLYKLAKLDLSGNTRLKNLPNMRHLTSLEELHLDGCTNLSEFPEIPVELTSLYLSETAIEEIPSFVGHFTNLQYLAFDHCRRLKRVSSGIFKLESMNVCYSSSFLDFSGCSELENFPEVLENKREIESLHLKRSAIKTLPASIELLSGLEELSLRYCKNLESLPNSLCNLTNLQTLDLSGCFGVEKILENVLSSSSSSSSSGLCSLSKLDLSECDMLEFPSALSCLRSLRELDLKGNKFESLSLKHFTSLTRLDISCCERLKYLQEFPLSSLLESVDASHCISLETLPDTTVVSTGKSDIYQNFQYYNCLKLDVKAIQTDAQTTIQLMANKVKETTSTSRREIPVWSCWPKVSFCFPGIEIPEWVSYQNDQGSSLTIDLPPPRYNYNFCGLVLCIVASCDSSNRGYPSHVVCTCNFMDSDLQENICYLEISRNEEEHPKSDHVFVKYYESGEDDSSLSSMYSLCQKVRFQFSPGNDCCKLKKFGVHLVYSEYKDESTESGDHDIAKEDQEEDSQKRIKQRNIVHEMQFGSDDKVAGRLLIRPIMKEIQLPDSYGLQLKHESEIASQSLEHRTVVPTTSYLSPPDLSKLSTESTLSKLPVMVEKQVHEGNSRKEKLLDRPSTSRLSELKELQLPDSNVVQRTEVLVTSNRPTPESPTPLPEDEISSDTDTDTDDAINVLEISQLKRLPRKLYSLKIESCKALESLTEELMHNYLQRLYIIDCQYLKSIQASHLPIALKTLYIRGCKKLEFLSAEETTGKHTSIEHLCIESSCDPLKSFPLALFPKLRNLSICDCANFNSISITEDHNTLNSLEIQDCKKLESLWKSGLGTPKLTSILLSNCQNLKQLPDLLHKLTSLQSLFIKECPEIDSIPVGGLPSSLNLLRISSCHKLTPCLQWGLRQLNKFICFEIEGGCGDLESFPEQNLLPMSLNSLEISTFPNLKVLNYEGLQHLTSLRTLKINSCDKLQFLPEEGLPSSLSYLYISDCPLLTSKLQNRRGSEWYKIAHIPHIQIDRKLGK